LAKPKNEKEFLRKILISLSAEKSVIVQNSSLYTQEEPVSSLVRYVAYNSKLLINQDSNKEANVSFSLRRKSNPELVNEFIPQGTIHIHLSPQSIKNIFILHKPNKDIDWTYPALDFTYFINIEFSQIKSMQTDGSGYNNHVSNRNPNKRLQHQGVGYIPGHSDYYGNSYQYPHSSHGQVFTQSNEGIYLIKIRCASTII
jgi:hypothetical protein